MADNEQVMATAGRLPVVKFADATDEEGFIYVLTAADAFWGLVLHDGSIVTGHVGRSKIDGAVEVSIYDDNGMFQQTRQVHVADITECVYL